MAIVNITTQNDADFYRVFTVQMADGSAFDLTGSTMEMMLRRHAQDEAAVLRLATDTGEIVIIDPPGGQFTLLIRQGSLLRLGLGDFDQSMISSRAGYKLRIWTGILTNNPGPTR
jgi:hypothetical protein